MFNNIINKLVISFKYESQSLARRNQNLIESIFNDQIQLQLEVAMADVCPEELIIELKRLVIDIGTISEGDIQTDLANRIKESLVYKFQTIHNIDERENVANINYKLIALNHYLQMGYFPKRINDSPEQLLVYLIEQNESDLTQVLNYHTANDSAMKRLSHSFEAIQQNQSSDAFVKFFAKFNSQRKAIKLVSLKENSILCSEDCNEIRVNNAGLILFWPFLTRFFEQLSLLRSREFVDIKSRNKAIFLLQYLVFKNIAQAEHELVLNKILVGMPLEDYLPPNTGFSENEIDLTNSLFNGLIQNWEKVKNATIEAIQETFIQREGILSMGKENNTLTICKIGVDVLIESIPWNLSLIKLPWMEKPINIEWL